ncbi:MAG TPA: YceI family protein [Campylobacterales bacterium]|nr:YceI family protein [Campylobacterales bacterium]
MKTAFKTLLFASLLCGGAFGAEFGLDGAHSSVGFSVKHLMVSNVKGKFNAFDGNFSVDDKTNKLTRFEGLVDTASIDTDVQKRDDHLKSPDFFDVAKYPKMSFAMTKFTPLKGSKSKVIGNLTIKNITKSVVFDAETSKVVTDMQGGQRIGVTLSSKINRKDFGLNWNKTLEAGGFVVGDEIKISVELEGVAK